MSGAALAVALLITIGMTVLLYFVIEQETSNTRITNRADAEREAQQRGGLDRSQQRTDESGDSDSEPTDEDDQWGYSRLEDNRS